MSRCQVCLEFRQISIFTHDISVSGTPAISVSGGQRLKPLKNKNFLICYIYISNVRKNSQR